MTGRLDLKTGDAWRSEPTAELLEQLDAQGLALEQPDPWRAVWVVIESERAIEERRRRAREEIKAIEDWRQAG